MWLSVRLMESHLYLQIMRELRPAPGLASQPMNRLELTCPYLERLPACIGKLHSVLLLNLEGCSKLQQLPSSIQQMHSLENLNLSGCSQLRQVPASVWRKSNLRKLTLVGCLSLEAPFLKFLEGRMDHANNTHYNDNNNNNNERNELSKTARCSHASALPMQQPCML